MKKIICFAFCALLVTQISANGQTALVTIDNLRPDDIHISGFVLDNDQEIKIEAVAFYARRYDYEGSFAWIIKADTREVVWDLLDARDSRRTRELRDYDDTVNLSKGTYEVYYSTFIGRQGINISSGNINSFLRNAFGGRDYRRSDFRDLSLSIQGRGRSLAESDLDKARQEFLKTSIVSITSVGDEEYEEIGFTLDRDMELEVYALGEELSEQLYDYGYILNANTRKRVWEMDFHNIDHAGGAEKNVMVKETITLPKGDYVAYYVTDDSHSARDWNDLPPYDPSFWGMTIRVKTESLKQSVKPFDFKSFEAKNVIVSFTRVRDDEYLSKGFTLKKDMDVRIYSIGEGTRDVMLDYGWIIDASTMEKVWEMEYYDTDHAGGAQKNRVFDGVVSLKKGNYVAYYVTDDAHSYRRWNSNSSRPLDQENWGLTISGASSDFKPGDIADFNLDLNQNVLVKMVRFGDNDYDSKRFTLDAKTKIRIYAIGEGTGNREMHDYGWIENVKTGRVVWEMRYRDTDNAGGARKNRMFNGVIELEAGEYIVNYETDGSHSYSDWNSTPPRDQASYGITIFKVIK